MKYWFLISEMQKILIMKKFDIASHLELHYLSQGVLTLLLQWQVLVTRGLPF